MGLNNFILTCEKDNEELRKDINYYKNLTSRLKKENQELKKQLEERTKMYQNAYDYSQKMEGKAIILEAQQKEFIKFLEDNYESTQDIWYIKILQKYKEIIEKGDVR